MPYITPSKEQFYAFKNSGYVGPIVMINLQKFKDADSAIRYERYAAFTIRLIKEQLGGRLIYKGKYIMPFIGEGDWDSVLIVEYPSIDAFLKMQRDEAYLKALPDRQESLADSRVFFTVGEVP